MYDQYYNLKEMPFRLTPDPKYYFESKGHKCALAYLRYGLRSGEGFVVITGEAGTGKTTLANRLIELVVDESDILTGRVDTTQIGADDMLRMIAETIGVKTGRKGKARILVQVEQELVHRAKNGKRTLIIIDEAQNLCRESLEEIRMLSNYSYENSPIIQCFLLGQDELRTRLEAEDMKQLTQRILAAYHFLPLDHDETKEYIEHRLTLAGWCGKPNFSEAAYVAIREITGGIARNVNTFTDRVLMLGYLSESDNIDLDQINEVAKEWYMQGRASNGASGDTGSWDKPAGLKNSEQTKLESRVIELEKKVDGIIESFISQGNKFQKK